MCFFFFIFKIVFLNCSVRHAVHYCNHDPKLAITVQYGLVVLTSSWCALAATRFCEEFSRALWLSAPTKKVVGRREVRRSGWPGNVTKNLKRLAAKHGSQIFCWFKCHVRCGTDLLKSQLTFDVFSNRLWRPQHWSMLCAVYSHSTVASFKKYVRSSNSKRCNQKRNLTCKVWRCFVLNTWLGCSSLHYKQLYWLIHPQRWKCASPDRTSQSLKITNIKLQDIHELAACRQQVSFYFVGSPTIVSTSA